MPGKHNAGGCGCCDECTPRTLGACECLDADYGNFDTIQRVDVVISGSSTCYEPNNLSGTGDCNGGSFTGADWSGTYSVNCSGGTGGEVWEVLNYACEQTSGGTTRDFYVMEKLSITLSVSGDTYTVDVDFESILYNFADGTTNPCPSITTSCSPGTSGSVLAAYKRTYTATQSYTDNNDTCTGTTTRRGCVSSLSFSSDLQTDPVDANAAYCQHSDETSFDLTISSVTMVNV